MTKYLVALTLHRIFDAKNESSLRIGVFEAESQQHAIGLAVIKFSDPESTIGAYKVMVAPQPIVDDVGVRELENQIMKCVDGLFKNKTPEMEGVNAEYNKGLQDALNIVRARFQDYLMVEDADE